MSLLLALACAIDRCDPKYEGRYCNEDTTEDNDVTDDIDIPNESPPEIDIDTDGDGDFDNANQYDGGEWNTYTTCSNPQLSHLIRGQDDDQANGAQPPEILVSIYAPYVPEYLIDGFDTTTTNGDYVYLDPATYLTEESPGIYAFQIGASELGGFCDLETQSLYLRFEAFDGVYTSDPIDVRVDFEGQGESS